MQTVIDSLYCVVVAVLPPLVSGPVPAILWYRLGASPNWKWQLPLAALLAIVLNLVASVLILANLNGILPLGTYACGLTILTAPATLLLARDLARRSAQSLPEDVTRRRWLQIGILVLPALQLLNIFLVILIAPALCKWGLRPCEDI